MACFANITTWSETTEEFLHAIDYAEIIGVVETHLAGTKLETAASKLSKLNWHDSASHALPSEVRDGDTYG